MIDINADFGQLTPKEIVRHPKTNKRVWHCECTCGNTCLVAEFKLVNRKQVSCGCYRKVNTSRIMWRGHRNLSGYYWTRVLHSAAKRNIPVQITIEDAWIQFDKQEEKCAITGVSLTLGRFDNSTKHFDQTASLDRIDSSKGYIAGNIQWVHKTINRMKADLTEEEFIRWCQLVTQQNAHLGQTTTLA